MELLHIYTIANHPCKTSLTIMVRTKKDSHADIERFEIHSHEMRVGRKIRLIALVTSSEVEDRLNHGVLWV